jgi:DNA-binding transcriptional LysR family regulator
LLCASPAYLARRGVPATPHDLLDHACIAFEGDGPVPERWSFGPPGAGVSVVVRPCLTVTTAEAAVDAAAAGLGFARPLSYQAEAALAAGWMTVVLREFEPVPVPVHIVQPSGRHPPPKVRVFVERAAMVLRARLAALNKAVVGA